MRASEILALAHRAGIAPGISVLDLCCGVAGPGRLIARELVDYQGQHAQKAVRTTLTRLFQRLTGLIQAAQRSGRFRADLDPAFASVSVVAQIAWFAVASPVVGTLLGDGAKGPSARKRRAFVRHAADFALSALEHDRGASR